MEWVLEIMQSRPSWFCCYLNPKSKCKRTHLGLHSYVRANQHPEVKNKEVQGSQQNTEGFYFESGLWKNKKSICEKIIEKDYSTKEANE